MKLDKPNSSCTYDNFHMPSMYQKYLLVSIENTDSKNEMCLLLFVRKFLLQINDRTTKKRCLKTFKMEIKKLLANFEIRKRVVYQELRVVIKKHIWLNLEVNILMYFKPIMLNHIDEFIFPYLFLEMNRKK